MNRNVIELGAFSWARIERLYDADAVKAVVLFLIFFGCWLWLTPRFLMANECRICGLIRV